MFDTTAGEKLHQIILLAQRSMHYACSLPPGIDIRASAAAGHTPLETWFTRLGVDSAEFSQAVRSYAELIRGSYADGDDVQIIYEQEFVPSGGR